jgi:hypothetical protein
MSTVIIKKSRIDKQKGVVILPVKEYKKLLARAVPTYYLTGREAEKLDRLVNDGFKEYKAGKTKVIKSLAELD